MNLLLLHSCAVETINQERNHRFYFEMVRAADNRNIDTKD